MITLPIALEKFMQGKDLKGLKPFALLYRNKWNAVSEKFELDSTPIDITALIAKPNTLSMTLDVNEVAQYNANNVTLTLEDTKNYFVEGTPNSYFPDGYQIYGSKVVLYYGLNTPINPYPTEVGYTVVGSPTITDGVASGFSSSNYLKTDTTFSQDVYNAWMQNSETVVKFRINALQAQHIIYIPTGGSYAGFYMRGSQGKINWQIYSTSYRISPDFVFSVNTDYWLKGTISNGVATFSYSTDGTNYTTLGTLDLQGITDPGSYTSYVQLGYGSAELGAVNGEIDLNNTYIKVNGEYWFNGAHFFWQNNSTPLFTGVIKELPTHKPEKYQVDVKLVSPLEMLKDIEAKDFSDKVVGEVLTLDHTGDNNEEYFLTAQKGVGGITALYANGVKLYEGVDYEVSDLSKLNYSATIEVKNSTVFGQTFTADYYYWKRGLSIDEIVAGVVALGGYSGATTDIQPVVWSTSVRSPSTVSTVFGALGYYESALNEYTFNWHSRYGANWQNTQGTGGINNILPANFDYSFTGSASTASFATYGLSLGDSYSATNINYTPSGSSTTFDLGACGVQNGITVRYVKAILGPYYVLVYSITNGTPTLLYQTYTMVSSADSVNLNFQVKKRGSTVEIYYSGNLVATVTINGSMDYHYTYTRTQGSAYARFLNQTWTFYDNDLIPHGENLTQPCIVTDTLDMTENGLVWGAVEATLGQDATYFLRAFFSTDGSTWDAGTSYNLGVNMSHAERYLYYILGVPNGVNSFDIKDPSTYFYATTLVLNIVNLGNSTVLEALQDLALISGYEFGIDRQGVFFFRPRVASTTPTYTLDGDEVVQVDTVKKSLNDFFTKLTLTFAEVPLEFYANTGTRPTAIDKYGVINKDIDKPEIVNYDNPELAQAIGPQLLEVYSALPSVIQATGKLNLALELADIVSLRRNYNLIADPEGTEFEKYINQQTYYRACKITGLNYNFSKKQITYTLRDVTDSYPNPQPGDLYEFVYDLPIRLGVK